MLKSFYRAAVFPAAIRLGLDKVLRRLSERKRIILMYHGVVPKPDLKLSVNHLSVNDFEQHMAYLNRSFKIRKLCDLFEDYRNDVVPKDYEVAITFDDGYANNYHYAFPVLKQLKMPATIFMVTKALDNPNHILWYDFIDGVKPQIDYKSLTAVNFGFPPSKEGVFKKIRDAESLKAFMKLISVIEKNRIIQWITEQGIQPDTTGHKEFFELLSAEQIKEMTDSGLIEIGSHTHNHPNLSEISVSEAEQEISYSKALIERITGDAVESIAFPDGSYNEEIKNLCINAGYRNLLAVDYKLKSDIYKKNILSRFCISNTTTNESNFLRLGVRFLFEP